MSRPTDVSVSKFENLPLVFLGWWGQRLDLEFVSIDLHSRSQGRGARASVARWCCSGVSCWRLSSSVWRWSSPAEVSFQRHPEAACATNTQQIWRYEFLGCRSWTVERPSTRASTTGTLIRLFSTIFENTSLWQLKRLVTLLNYSLRYINNFIYLSIYLHSNHRPSSILTRSLWSPFCSCKSVCATSLC